MKKKKAVSAAQIKKTSARLVKVNTLKTKEANRTIKDGFKGMTDTEKTRKVGDTSLTEEVFAIKQAGGLVSKAKKSSSGRSTVSSTSRSTMKRSRMQISHWLCVGFQFLNKI